MIKSVSYIPTDIANRTPYSKNTIFTKKPISKFPGYKSMPEEFQAGNVEALETELNSYNFRCDEFKKNHTGLHILFSGCSYTFGSGLLLEETWAKKLYNRISQDTECSGYFNLGVPGNSVMGEVFDLFRYFNEYGNPDFIFFNMPDISRFYAINTNNDICDAFYLDESSFNQIIEVLNYQYYTMLYQYCKSNNIKLISFSWVNIEDEFDESFKKNNINTFDTFYQTDIKEIKKFIKEYKNNNKDIDFIEMSRDGVHQGIGYHEYWANFIYDKYLEMIQ